MIKLQFDPLKYQEKAVNAVVDLFAGQTPKHSNFTVQQSSNQYNLYEPTLGIGNYLEIDSKTILSNLQQVQQQNGIKPSSELGDVPYPEFEIDMETGTGKTFVYINTIFQLNKKYGFTKFIVVVPSLAIKEGAYKNLEITKDEVTQRFGSEPYNFFVYDSSRLDQVRNFATADNIEIMIINIQAFNRSFSDPEKENSANIIHRTNDRLSGQKPIKLIAKTNPLVIIDEPQSVDTTPRSKEALKSLNPLCTFRYSATHKDINNPVYRLDAIDAYEQKLVKQIEVTSFHTKDDFEAPYLKLISTNSKKTEGISAKIEIDKKMKSGTISKQNVTVKKGSDIQKLAGDRSTYAGFQVEEINHEQGFVSFTSRSELLTVDNQIGGIPDLKLKSMQIEATIREHLDKELLLNHRGIKVLSLFFLDRVGNYRSYDKDGNPQKGIYAIFFEEHYNRIVQEDKYISLFKDNDIGLAADKVHDGYFSIDTRSATKGQFRDTSGNIEADNSAYELIMKDKEKLLSLDTPLKFIFSHSALKEGWDNPNVFQICTLNETKSDMKKRQEIGRGLRLCVNQAGIRQHGFELNTLTVVANESYEQFAESLQKEYEEDAGISFGYILPETFSNLSILNEDGEPMLLGYDKSNELYEFFKEKEYIDKNGKIMSKLEKALEHSLLEVPESMKALKDTIADRIKRTMRGLQIKNSADRKPVIFHKERFLSPEFQDIWERIKYKTTYHVSFDSEKLVDECIKDFKNNLSKTKRKIEQVTAAIKLGKGGVYGTKGQTTREYLLGEVSLDALPNIVTELQNSTDLTRKTIVDILVKSGTLGLFANNPQIYMQDIAKSINHTKQRFIIDGIKYTKLGNEHYYAQELFETEELFGYLGQNMIETAKERNIYSHVLYDSGIEKNFAENLEIDSDIISYTKLPAWFKIPTPLGSYNPDWAIVTLKKEVKRLFFVIETKGTLNLSDLRGSESDKIFCGEKHFAALNKEITFFHTDSFANFQNKIS